MSELAALGTVLVVIRFLFVLETALAADKRRARGRTETRICIARSTRVGNRGERMSSGCGNTGCSVGIGDASGGIAGSASCSAAHASAAHAAHASATHTHASATTGVDNDMGHARMTSDNLPVHGDGGHPTSDVGYLLALGFDASRSRKLVPVSEL